MPLKTPLDERYFSQMEPKHYFTPGMFLDSVQTPGQKVGLWVNLAFTDRFYNKEEIEKRGVTYVKLACRGHGETPTEEQVKAFIQLCSGFFDKNPDSLIAVHCTHGFNRTGFLIAAYLYEVDEWDIATAVHRFALQRPPGIYKKDYLEELFKRYGDISEMPPVPELPDWCFEEETPDEAGDDQVNGGPRRKEFTKKDPVFMAGVDGVSPIEDEKELSRIRIKVQRMVGWTSSGFPGAQPVSMTRENMKYLVDMPYMVSWKADGTRYMLLIEDRDKTYFIDRDNSVFQIHGITFPDSADYREKHLKDTLCDGEMVIDTDPELGTKLPRFLIYDIIVINGTNRILRKDFKMRFDAIKEQVVDVRHRATHAGIINRAREPFGIRRKDFYNLSATEKVMNMNTGHEHDGLIFQPIPLPYTGGQCDHILKWKPPHLNSIDFKCQVAKITEMGCLPETYAMMYVGGHPPVMFAKQQLKRSQISAFREYDGKIVECTLGSDRQWKVLRIRTDKSHPNSHRTAESVLKSIMEPVTKDFVLNLVHSVCMRHTEQEKRKGNMPPPSMLPKHARI